MSYQDHYTAELDRVREEYPDMPEDHAAAMAEDYALDRTGRLL